FSGDDAISKITNNRFDIILCDYRLPDTDGMEILQKIRNQYSHLPVIIMTSYADIRIAVKAIKNGAFEYVTKPVNPDEIWLTITNALQKNNANSKIENSVEKTAESKTITSTFLEGVSVQAHKLLEFIDIVAPTNISVIIQGDSGTGKEFIAKRIHEKSNRSNKPFVSIDCGALSKELAASELFGHIKGSFTGAIADKTGQFVAADKGTLFLDEIGNLSYEVQVQLLRAIQERKIRKIGSNNDVDVDVRLLVATNEDLVEAVKKGDFREDLYHRLNEFKILVPPLRERHDDITYFAEHFLKISNQELGKKVIGFSEDVMEIFKHYSWPGNFRELRNIIRRATLLAQGNIIPINVLPSELMFENLTNSSSKSMAGSTDLKAIAERTEKEMILKTLESVNYNKSKAALLLNIDRKTLYNKIKQYNIRLGAE
ncbi:MAG TPA: sigma-54 dependent transcriptional regulator, partial [Chitinophagales bacterium]|nr:sigma-54 dependent transcriptional regulator [Chitinophagales bacterium]